MRQAPVTRCMCVQVGYDRNRAFRRGDTRCNTFPERIFLRIGNSMLDRAQRSASIDRDSSAMALYSVTYKFLDRIR